MRSRAKENSEKEDMGSVPIVRSSDVPKQIDVGATNRLVGIALWAVAIVFVAGTAIDFVVLWVLQRLDQPQWEFVALSNTAEGMGRPILGLGLAFAGSAIAGWQQRWLIWALSTASILGGITGIAIATLIGTDYVALAPQVEGQQLEAMKSVAAKGAALGALYGIVLIPLGIMGFRKPKTK